MNTVKQIEILFYLTIIEHIILVSICMFLLIRRWVNSYSRTRSVLNEIREELNEIKYSIKNEVA